ncbi:hypothetical protein AA103196_0149 [Ameyamaea chiangmaiensis NBRC 103196]|uniref:Secreted protein n=1 Tax=Ameyamaea chiangmaiensis TaxID=442969 RepID=A0A850PF21_9PROT|nr:hypothetical protein [Ameyamaea chiangmaiensis]MBS4076423.1 hypothetical protein [Ameyamaea chiangmaiensis]NVN41443.1 hypothetical protein [Ameyamaea chiangmaiensis]GBQ61829.1 hypothetical protein AA103196_0149 [Ameyamaea chiangmaiensis NBRC 103196]
MGVNVPAMLKRLYPPCVAAALLVACTCLPARAAPQDDARGTDALNAGHTSAPAAPSGEERPQLSPEEGESAPPVTVTSNGPRFCAMLLQAIDDSSEQPLPNDVRALREEGIGLCQQGRTHLGITRLRRALVALREEHDTP